MDLSLCKDLDLHPQEKHLQGEKHRTNVPTQRVHSNRAALTWKRDAQVLQEQRNRHTSYKGASKGLSPRFLLQPHSCKAD